MVKVADVLRDIIEPFKSARFLSKRLVPIVCLGIILTAACRAVDGPVPSQEANARALSGDVLTVRSYVIPKGIFRGVLWPGEKDRDFVAWVIDSNQREHFFRILAPPEFADHNKDTSREWNIRLIGVSGNRATYLAERRDKSKKIRIDLPAKKREYSFSVLGNPSGEEMILSMDISETVSDTTGFFAYVMMK